MNVALVGQRIDRVRSLTGFRSTHRVPDEVNEFTEAFVAKIASEQIDQDLEKMFAAMRNHFRFKRTEINVTDGDACGEATIATPHFEYTVAVSLNPANPAQVVWRRQLSEIHDLSQILSHASTEVFGPMFDTVELSPPHPVDLEALIDRIEAIEGEQIKVDYDKQTTWCKVEIAGILGELQVSARSISLVQQTVKSPGILLQSFLDFQTALIETYGVGAMTFNGSANARID